MNKLAVLPLALFLHACCSGPFVYVDCAADELRIVTHDTEGIPNDVDRVQWRIEGDTEWSEAECFYEGQSPCADWYVMFPEEGTLEVQALEGDDVVASELLEVEYPKRNVGQCCSGVYSGTLQLEV